MSQDISFLKEIKIRLKYQSEELKILRAQLRVVNIFETALSANHNTSMGTDDFDLRISKYIEHIENQHEQKQAALKEQIQKEAVANVEKEMTQKAETIPSLNHRSYVIHNARKGDADTDPI